MSAKAVAREWQFPLLRIDLRLRGKTRQIYAKNETLNMTGSVKDRIAVRMVEGLEKTGRARPGETVLIEPTSGNTGAGLAMVAAVRGYRLVITMPDRKRSTASSSVFRAFAERVSNSARVGSPRCCDASMKSSRSLDAPSPT